MRIKIDGLKEGSNHLTFASSEITGKDLHGFIVINSDDLEVEIQKSGNYLHVTGSGKVEYEVQCDRCAESYPTEQFFNIDYIFHIGELFNNTDDIVIIDPDKNEGNIIFDDFFSESFIIAQPLRHLCSEDCHGICQKCGKNLNEGSCGCSDEKPIDPRWEKLQEILNKNKP